MNNTTLTIENSDFVKHHCWLVNTTGKPGMFCPVDRAQEHNIKDIKVTYRSEGPNVKWEYMKKLHPAIHTIRAIAIHIESEFGTLSRGKKHGVPKKEIDVAKLQKVYNDSGYHKYTAGRVAKKDTTSEDYATEGALKAELGKVLEQWRHRRTFVRSTSERWPGDSDGSETTEEEHLSDSRSDGWDHMWTSFPELDVMEWVAGQVAVGAVEGVVEGGAEGE